MTEKRFILCNKTTDSNVWDTLDKQYYSLEYVVSLLNYLNDENKELKIENRQLKRQNKALKDSSLIDAYNQYIKNCTIQSNRECKDE